MDFTPLLDELLKRDPPAIVLRVDATSLSQGSRDPSDRLTPLLTDILYGGGALGDLGRESSAARNAPEPDATEEPDDARDRLFLLCRRYGGRGLSKEERARLAILTERIEAVFARETEPQLQLMVEHAELGVRAGASFASLRVKVGAK